MTLESIFCSQIFIEYLLCAEHWARKRGHGNEQVQCDCCSNSMGNDAVVIKVPKTFAPEIEDSDKVRQKSVFLLFYFLLIWAPLRLELIDSSRKSCWRQSECYYQT